jgi:hypothetical protein
MADEPMAAATLALLPVDAAHTAVDPMMVSPVVAASVTAAPSAASPVAAAPIATAPVAAAPVSADPVSSLAEADSFLGCCFRNCCFHGCMHLIPCDLAWTQRTLVHCRTPRPLEVILYISSVLYRSLFYSHLFNL